MAVVVEQGDRSWCGALYAWRPGEGYFTITCDACGELHTFRLNEVDSAVDHGVSVGKTTEEHGETVPVLKDVDLIERAIQERYRWAPPNCS